MKSDWIPETFDRPEIVCLIGSSRFKGHHEEVQAKLTLEGKIVLPMGLYGHLSNLDMNGPVKKMLDELHLKKIDLADGVFVVNPNVRCCPSCGKPTVYLAENTHRCWDDCKQNFSDKEVIWKRYIGESTSRELTYARAKGKTVYSLEPLE